MGLPWPLFALGVFVIEPVEYLLPKRRVLSRKVPFSIPVSMNILEFLMSQQLLGGVVTLLSQPKSHQAPVLGEDYVSKIKARSSG